MISTNSMVLMWSICWWFQKLYLRLDLGLELQAHIPPSLHSISVLGYLMGTSVLNQTSNLGSCGRSLQKWLSVNCTFPTYTPFHYIFPFNTALAIWLGLVNGIWSKRFNQRLNKHLCTEVSNTCPETHMPWETIWLEKPSHPSCPSWAQVGWEECLSPPRLS